MHEDRQKSEALTYFQGSCDEGAAADVAAQQPLEPPLAALRDAMLADASALQRRATDLQECLQVGPCPPDSPPSAAAVSGIICAFKYIYRASKCVDWALKPSEPKCAAAAAAPATKAT